MGSITGNLKTMVLSEVLQWLSLGLKSGTLRIQGHGIEKRVYFQDGRIASSSSTDQREYLGHFLVSHGYISEEELRTAMQVQEESSILIGKILVMINAISETDLLRVMRRKAEESIYDIFLWSEGEFEFLDNVLPDQQMILLSLDVTGIIMEGLRRFDEWNRIREILPSLCVAPSVVRPIVFEKLSDQEKLILPYLNGERTIDEIALQTHNSEFVVARMVYEGLRLGTMAAEERLPLAEEASSVEPEVAKNVEDLLRRGREVLNENPESAWRMFSAASELDSADGRPRDALKEAEELLHETLAFEGIELSQIPVLCVPMTQLTKFNFTPNEGFVLSRVNGVWDVKSIVKISPIREMEVLLALRKLAADGVINWKEKK
jgi:hypothetical protein